MELGEFVMKEGREGVVGVCHAPNPIPGFVTIGEINCRWVLVFLIRHKLKIEVNSINGDSDKIDTCSDLIRDPKGLFGLE